MSWRRSAESFTVPDAHRGRHGGATPPTPSGLGTSPVVSTPIGVIGPFDVQEWIADLHADGYAPATIRKAYQLLGRIVNAGVTSGLIARNRVWLPAVNGSVGQPMRFHDLRHSHVALLIAQGAHPAIMPPGDASDVDAMWTRRIRRDDQERGLA